MPIRREDVILGYRLILGRMPESEATIAAHASHHDSVETFGESLLASEEGQARTRSALHPLVMRRLGLTEPDVAELRAVGADFWPTPRPGFVSDFAGIYTRLDVADLPPQSDQRHYSAAIPMDFHAEAIEWLALLRAVGAAEGRFVMAEIGAGWGAWTAAAHSLARRRGLVHPRLYAIEADAENMARMRTHLADNAIPSADTTLLQEVVTDVPGDVLWTPVMPGTLDLGGRARAPGEPEYRGLKGGLPPERRRGLPMTELLGREPVWDFIHLDVQGLEERLCRAALADLTQRVRFLFIATHSKSIDAACFTLLHQAGWTLVSNLAPLVVHAQDPPSIEALTVLDGAQFWRNPRSVR